MNGEKLNVVVCYRVLQQWRVPVFDMLNLDENINLTVVYSDDFEGTKIKSFEGGVNFETVKLKSKNIKIKTKNGYAYVPIPNGLYTALNNINPDVIIVEGASNFFSNIVCFLYAKIKKKKIVQWGLGEIRGRTRSLHRKILDLIFRPMEKASDAIISYSSVGKSYYERIGVHKNKIFVAVNVVNTIERRRAHLEQLQSLEVKHSNDEFNICYVGALSENKNVELLIDVFFSLKKDHNNISLHIVGDGPLKGKLEEYIGSSSNVYFYGHLDNPSCVMSGADVFVLPGLGGLAVSDALCHDLPVICGVGDGCEVDLINNNGLILDNMNKSNLLRTLNELIYDRDKLNEWKDNCYKSILEGKTINDYVRNIKNAIYFSIKS